MLLWLTQLADSTDTRPEFALPTCWRLQRRWPAPREVPCFREHPRHITWQTLLVVPLLGKPDSGTHR